MPESSDTAFVATNDSSMNSFIGWTMDLSANHSYSTPHVTEDIGRLNYFNEKSQYMKEIETKLNNEIGYRFWKRYVNSAFWSYLSMPINLSITMLTALSTGQATTDNLLPKSIYVNVALATLVLSVLNTYFRPYVQMTNNVELMNRWNDLGCEFESIIYSEKKKIDHIEHRLVRYEELMEKVNDLKKQEVLETQNFLTDSIYLGIRSVNWCLKDRDSWLSLDESYKKEDRRKKVNVETSISENDRVKYIDSSSNAADIVMYTSASAKPNHPTHTNTHAMNPAKSNIRNVVYKAVNRELLTNTFDPRRKMDNVMNQIERNLRENIHFMIDSSDNNV